MSASRLTLPSADELQHGRRDKGLGDAGGTDVGVRGESGAGVDVGVCSGVPGEVGAITNHGNAAGEVVGRNDAG